MYCNKYNRSYRRYMNNLKNKRYIDLIKNYRHHYWNLSIGYVDYNYSNRFKTIDNTEHIKYPRYNNFKKQIKKQTNRIIRYNNNMDIKFYGNNYRKYYNYQWWY